MGLIARVLVMARDDELVGPLTAGLDRLGWRTVTARSLHAGLAALTDFPIEAVVAVVDGDVALTQAIARRLKGERSPRQLPVLGLGQLAADVDGAFDLTLAPPLEPAQAAQRLEQLVRGAIAEEEVELRRQTFLEQGCWIEPPAVDSTPYRVLAIGEPSPTFLGLSHALKLRGAEVTGAFTPYTAFDYLHERPFDAVVLWGGESQTEALAIASGMRRNTRLYHVPTVLYLRSTGEFDLADAFRRGLSDVAAADTPEDETARRVITLARAYRRETAIRRALDHVRGSELMDAATGLFTRELFAAHLARLAEALRARRRPLSLAVLSISDRPEIRRARLGGWLDRALPQMGSMIGRLVRAEDTAARIAEDVFAFALPGASDAAARSAAERIAAVIGCTAFQGGDDDPPFTVEFQIGVAEVQPGERASHALERAAHGSLALAAS